VEERLDHPLVLDDVVLGVNVAEAGPPQECGRRRQRAERPPVSGEGGRSMCILARSVSSSRHGLNEPPPASQVTTAIAPPGRRTRCASRRAAIRLGRYWSVNDDTTASAASSATGRRSATPLSHSMRRRADGSSVRAASARPMSSIPDEGSIAIAPALGQRVTAARAHGPDPAPTSTMTAPERCATTLSTMSSSRSEVGSMTGSHQRWKLPATRS
jgi:hypothetical protein